MTRDASFTDEGASEPADLTAPPLSEGEVHVWSTRLDPPRSRIERLGRLLDSEEAAKASRFRFEGDRDAFMVARGMLRALLGRYLGERPERIRFVYGAYGKPALAPQGAKARVRFNVSHSDALVLFAFARSAEVGIDVERVRAQPDLEGIAERFFSRKEVAALRRLPASAREKAFFHCWTAKEALIKGIGEGLSMPLDCFSVSLGPPEGPIRLRVLDVSRLAPAWRLHRLETCPGYVAALAVETRRFRLRRCEWSPEEPTC